MLLSEERHLIVMLEEYVEQAEDSIFEIGVVKLSS
jgi:hypothetical protein